MCQFRILTSLLFDWCSKDSRTTSNRLQRKYIFRRKAYRLNHEAFDDAVEDDPVVVAVAGMRAEVLYRLAAVKKIRRKHVGRGAERYPSPSSTITIGKPPAKVYYRPKTFVYTSVQQPTRKKNHEKYAQYV